MSDGMKRLPPLDLLSGSARKLARRWLDETAAIATVEFALVAPAMLGLMAMIVFAGQGFEIQRKVTLTMRTLTDLVTQQTAIGLTSATNYNYTQILNAASLVIAPYDATPLTMVISEIQTNGTANGTVVWSKGTSNATALTVGSSVAVPANLQNSGYLVLGTVSYTYTPLQIVYQSSGMTLSDSIYMAPRVSSNILCCT